MAGRTVLDRHDQDFLHPSLGHQPIDRPLAAQRRGRKSDEGQHLSCGLAQ
jgi:hypothetical protein